MKKQYKYLTAAFLAGALLVGSCAAYTMTELPSEEIFAPEIIEREAVSDWAKSEIDAARAAGLITADCSSYMTHNITRQQFAGLAVNLVEKMVHDSLPLPVDKPFTDCDSEAVEKASMFGIVNGVGDGRFDPQGELTREQLATMLHRTLTRLSFEAASAGLDGYTDAGDVSPWAAEAVGGLAAVGIMKGTSGTTLTPQGPCTVEQSILLIYRLYQYMNP